MSICNQTNTMIMTCQKTYKISPWVFFFCHYCYQGKTIFAFLSPYFPRNSRRVAGILVFKVTPPNWLSFVNAQCLMPKSTSKHFVHNSSEAFFFYSGQNFYKGKYFLASATRLFFLSFGLFILYSGINIWELHEWHFGQIRKYIVLCELQIGKKSKWQKFSHRRW